MEHDKMVTAYIKAVIGCNSYDDGNILAELLPSIERLTDKQTQDLINAFNDNSQVHFSYGFTGEKPTRYGKGLIYHLERIIKQKYKVDKRGDIKLV
jgi:hypothetical protein